MNGPPNEQMHTFAVTNRKPRSAPQRTNIPFCGQLTNVTFLNKDSTYYEHSSNSTPQLHKKPTSISSGNAVPARSITQRRKPVIQNLTFVGSKKHISLTPPSTSINEFAELDFPPPKRRRIENVVPTLSRRNLFRPSEPLKNSHDVDNDIWQNILSFCDPAFLLRAKSINSFFYNVLKDHQSIWRRSRLRRFGDGMPERPRTLTEEQYVDLLIGRGCQSMTCMNKDSTKVYWTFLGRFCGGCFARRTMKPDDLAPDRQHSIPRLIDEFHTEDEPLWSVLALAEAHGRRYIQSRFVDHEYLPGWEAPTKKCFLFLKSDYTKLELEYLQLKEEGSDVDQIRDWWQKKKTELMKDLAEIVKLEIWAQDRAYEKRDVRDERRDFFRSEAQKLDPPMTYAVLSTMSAYHKALNTYNEPSERAWKVLKAKILPYRKEAEAVVQNRVRFDRFSPAAERFRRLHAHRSGRKAVTPAFRPEQNFIMEIAEDEVEKCLTTGVADCDLVLRSLKNIYGRYYRNEKRPTGLNYNGEVGPYLLSMDDARMIIEEVIEPRISRFSHRGAVIYESFKCAGCMRRDFSRTFSFDQVFEHILKTHSQRVGEGLEFWRFVVPFPRGLEYDHQAFRFPWYTVPWPRCLPVLACHQNAFDLPPWHPDADMVYEEATTTQIRSLFIGRIPFVNSLPNDDFTGNYVFALGTLNGANLSNACMTKIALHYSLERLQGEEFESEPKLENFMAAFPSAREANSGMDFKYKCGCCKKEGQVYRRARQVKYFVSMEQLHRHWMEKHQTRNWLEDFMDLPSLEEVSNEIVESDKRLSEQKEAILMVAADNRDKTRKRPRRTNVKASVILNAKMAMDLFEQLFVRRDDEVGDEDNESSDDTVDDIEE